jgi:hypothetical protein
MGWETSCLGYPTGDATAMFTIGGRYLGMRQSFQGGTITARDAEAPTSSCQNRVIIRSHLPPVIFQP